MSVEEPLLHTYPGSTDDDVPLLTDHGDTSTAANVQQTSVPPNGSHRQSRTSHSSGSRTRHSRRGHSQRSRSSNGSRSRRHHSSNGRHGRHRCRSYFRHKERNIAAASCSMLTIVLLCTSLEPNWIRMSGGDCHLLHNSKGTLHSLSTREFFYNGEFYKNYPLTTEGDIVYKFGSSSNDIMVNCVTYTAVLFFKASIAFTMIAVIFSFAAFLLDLFGPNYQLFKMLRRNAILNILTVVMCVTINLFVYWITDAVQKLQLGTRLHVGSRVEVNFHVSFYLITAAGGMSVLATACNCLRRPRVLEQAAASRPRDHCYFEDAEDLLPPIPPSSEELTTAAPLSSVSSLPPPPPYTP